MTRVIKRKSMKTKPIHFVAGDWEVYLQTLEGKKVPLLKTVQERLYFQRDFQAKICFRRIR